MKESFVKRMNKDFFDGKNALLTKAYMNFGDETIEKDTIVTIISKHQDWKTLFNIKDKNDVYINGVPCEFLELINE